MSQVRTITYKIQMLTADGEKKGRAFSSTLSKVGNDSKTVEKSLQKLGDTVSKETGANFRIVTDDTAAFKNELRQLTRQVSKAERNFESVTRDYRQMSAMAGRSAEQQERLNAIFRLGAGATLTQKKEVVRLVRQYQNLQGATKGASGSMRNFRGQVNNASFQMQDILVQMQAGTAGFTIFAQQGSQLAASLGKNGPLIGAGVALVGMLGGLLFPALKNSGKAAQELNEKMKDLAKTVGLTKAQALELAKEQKKNIEASDKEIKAMDGKIKKLTILNQTFDQWKIAQETLAKGNSSTLNFVNPANALKNYNDQLEKAVSEATTYLATIDTETIKRKEAVEALALYNLALKGGTDTIKANIDANKQMVSEMEKQVSVVGMTEAQLLAYNREVARKQLIEQDATETQKASVLAGYDQLILLAEQEEKAKKLAKSVKELAAEEANRIKLLTSLEDEGTMIAVLEARYKKEQALLAGNLKAQKKLTENFERDKLKIQGTSLEKYMLAVEDSMKTFDTVAMNSIENFSTGFGQAVSNAIFESDSLGDALKGIFVGVAKNMVAFFAEWAAQELLLWTLKQALGTATQTAGATTATANASAMSLQAGLAAFASTAAIPIIGPALAPGAMGAALAVTAPMAAAISSISFAGALDKGGRIPQDAYGIISEYGSELMDGMLVKGAKGGSRVTSREDTAELLNGSRGGDTFSINSYGNASAEQIANSLVRKMKRKRGSKQLNTAIYEASQSGSRNRGNR